MDVWNIFSIERRSAFLRFRLVDDDDFDDVLSGEKRSSMVDSEDFGEEDIAPKKKCLRVPPTKERLLGVAKKRRLNTTKEGEGEKREKIMTGVFFCFFFSSQMTKDEKK